MKEKKYQYIQSFTGLRGVAVLMVILYHILPQIFRGGFLGVIIFFALAGFLMMRKFTEEKEVDLKRVLTTRFIKLYPQVIFMVVIICFISIFLLPGKYHGVKMSAIASLFSVNNYYQIINKISYFESHGAFMPFRHMWAMSMEMQFYLVFSLLIKVLMEKIKRNYIEVTLFAITVVSGILMCATYFFTKDASLVYYALSARLFSFTWGALISYQMRRKYHSDWINFNKNIFTNIFFFVILMMTYIATSEQPFQYAIGMFLFSLMTAWFLALIYHGDTWVAKLLEQRPLVFLGEISFELYLWQYPISAIVNEVLAHTKISFVWNFVIQVTLTFAVAFGVHQLFQRNKIKPYLQNIKYVGIALGVAVLLVAIPTFQVKDDTQSMKQILEQRMKEQEQQKKAQHDKQVAKENIKNISEELQTQIKELSTEYPKAAVNIEKFALHRDQNILVIGDSIILMAQEELQKYYPNIRINGEISRQFKDGPDILADELSNAEYDTFVIQLGTNGTFSTKDFDRIMKQANGKDVFFINAAMPDSFEGAVNNLLEECVGKYKNAHLVDWYDLAKEESDIFYDDKTHPNGKGAKLYAQCLVKKISETIK